MNLLRIAARLEYKLSLASGLIFTNIQKVRQSVRQLLQLKDLFLNASDDETTTQITLNNLDLTSKMYYLNARDYGISASQHAGYLDQLFDDIDYLYQIKGKMQPSNDSSKPSSKQIDPMVYSKLDQVKTLLHNIVPIALAPQAPQKPRNNAVATTTTKPAPTPQVNQYMPSPNSQIPTSVAPISYPNIQQEYQDAVGKLTEQETNTPSSDLGQWRYIPHQW